jgi:hypothetical protein
MEPSLLAPHFWSDRDILRVRKLLGWQSVEHNGKVWCGTIPLTDLQHIEIVLFSSYALVGLTLQASSFFLTLLENYSL